MKGADNGHIKRFLASTIEGTTLKKNAPLWNVSTWSHLLSRAHGESSPKFASLTMLPGEKTSLEELRQIMTKSRQEPFILHLITLEVSKLINNQKSDKCSLITYYSRWRTHNLRRPLISALEAFFSKKTLVELQAKNESFAKVFFFLSWRDRWGVCLDE